MTAYTICPGAQSPSTTTIREAYKQAGAKSRLFLLKYKPQRLKKRKEQYQQAADINGKMEIGQIRPQNTGRRCVAFVFHPVQFFQQRQRHHKQRQHYHYSQNQVIVKYFGNNEKIVPKQRRYRQPDTGKDKQGQAF